MQDNRKYQQQVIERGWQQMSALLDVEMPEASKRRRFGAWWFVAAGIMLSLAVLGYYSWQNSQPNQLESPIAEKKVETAATSQKPVDSNVSQSSEGKTGLSDEVDQITDQKVAGSVTSSASSEAANKGGDNSGDPLLNTASADVVAMNTIREDRTPVISRAQNNFEKASESQESIFVLPNGVLAESENVSIAQTHNSLTYTNTELPSVREEISLARLSTISPNAQLIPNPSLTKRGEPKEGSEGAEVAATRALNPSIPVFPLEVRQSSTIIPASSPARDRDFSLEGLIATHLNSDGSPFYGVEAGLNTTVFSNKRLSVQAGATYGYYTVDGLGLFNTNGAEDLAVGNTGGGPGYFQPYAVQDVVDGALAYSEAKQLTDKFHYIHVPVRVEYRITPNFSVMAGMKLSALVAAPARYRLDDEERFVAVQSPASASRSFLYSYDILRKFDVAPLVGMSYSIGERLSLDASYSHGLVHYINNPDAGDRNDFHRSAALGVRYRIL